MSRKSPKKYEVKVYDRSSVFKGKLGELSDYSLTKSINGSLGSRTFKLPVQFDSEIIVDGFDEIRVEVSDKDTNGFVMYSGYVDEIDRSISSSSEYIDLSVVGYGARLGYTLDRTVSSPIVSRQNIDPGNAFKDMIDKYRAQVDYEKINYDTNSVDLAGFNASYDSKSLFYLESIEEWLKLAGADYWWFINAYNKAIFKRKATTAKHLFTFGSNITEFTTKTIYGDIISEVLFWNSLQKDDTNFLSRLYYSNTVKANYWSKAVKVTNGNIKSANEADLICKSMIEASSSPNKYIEFTVKDNNFADDGYDTESIEIGDTCKILNLPPNYPVSDNMQITGITYNENETKIKVGELYDDTSKTLTDIQRAIDRQTSEDGVDTITLVDADS